MRPGRRDVLQPIDPTRERDSGRSGSMEEHMRLSHLFFVLVTLLLLPGTSIAEESAADASAAGDALDWDQFDDPSFEPEVVAPSDAVAAEDATGTTPVAAADADAPAGLAPVAPVDDAATAVADDPASWVTPDTEEITTSGVVLGPEGVDDQGRTGRLHTVARGDTLWDLSAAYLGTPWVWPSVWIDNDDIANPHLIMPGDKIWITANEMRVVTDAEAEAFLQPRVAATEVAAPVDEFGGDMIPPLAALDGAEDDPSTLDAFPVAIPGQEPGRAGGIRQITVSSRERMGFVSADDLDGASSIVGSPSERTFLSEGNTVFVGMGEGDVELGDQFTIFRVLEEVRDTETNRVLGHHVENLGWLEIEELTGDTSVAMVRESYSELRRGAKLIPRAKPTRSVTLRTSPDAIEGEIVYLPSSRTVAADGGYVYLNRGEFHGIEVGSALEVFDPGAVVNERERRVDVRTPDRAVARLVVVSVEEDSSVAFVLTADRELEIGDAVRPAVERIARR